MFPELELETSAIHHCTTCSNFTELISIHASSLPSAQAKLGFNIRSPTLPPQPCSAKRAVTHSHDLPLMTDALRDVYYAFAGGNYGRNLEHILHVFRNLQTWFQPRLEAFGAAGVGGGAS